MSSPAPIKPTPVAHPTDLAKFAAQGVALALNARTATHVGPFHIICGIPAEMFNINLVPNAKGELGIGGIEPVRQG